MVELLNGELCDGVEGSKRIDHVAEELDAEGVFVGEGEYVYNAATDGELAGVHNEVDTLEVVVLEHVYYEIHREFRATCHGEGLAGEGAAGDHLLAQGLWISDHHEAALGVKLLDHLAASQHVGVVGLEEVAPIVLAAGALFADFAATAAIRGGEEQGAFLIHIGVPLVQHGLNVVEEVVGLLFASRNEQLPPVGVLLRHSGRHHSGKRACHPIHVQTVLTFGKGLVEVFNYL